MNPHAELRVEGDASGVKLIGNAIVYNSLSENLGCFREIIAPGAFTESLKSADVRCLIDHNPSLLLGRNVSGTLRLSDGPTALRFECDLDDTSYALDLAKTVRRKDRDSCSFGFIAEEDTWEEDETGIVRTVFKAEIFDVSAVTYPAYKATSLDVRAASKALTPHPCLDTTFAVRSLEAWRSTRPEKAAPGVEIRRLKTLLDLRSLRP